MSPTAAKLDEPVLLSNEIRDGLLQDLIAVGLILRRLEATVSEARRDDVVSAGAVLDGDVRLVRDLIDRLRGVDRAA